MPAPGYSCLEYPVENELAYALVSFREEDALSIARWRNEQMQVLRQKHRLTDEGQLRYFHEVVVPSMSEAQPSMVLASFLLHDRCIGYGGLTHVDWAARRAEVSFLVETDRTKDYPGYQRDFISFLGLLKVVAFERLQLQRLFAETYDLRPYHVGALEAAKFKPEGRLRKHYMIDGVLTDGLLHGLLREEYGV